MGDLEIPWKQVALEDLIFLESSKYLPIATHHCRPYLFSLSSPSPSYSIFLLTEIIILKTNKQRTSYYFLIG